MRVMWLLDRMITSDVSGCLQSKKECHMVILVRMKKTNQNLHIGELAPFWDFRNEFPWIFSHLHCKIQKKWENFQSNQSKNIRIHATLSHWYFSNFDARILFGGKFEIYILTLLFWTIRPSVSPFSNLGSPCHVHSLLGVKHRTIGSEVYAGNSQVNEWTRSQHLGSIQSRHPLLFLRRRSSISQLCMWLNGRKFPANHTSSVCAFSFLANPRKLLPHLPSFPNNGHHVVDRWFILFARVCIGRLQRFGFSSTKLYYRI